MAARREMFHPMDDCVSGTIPWARNMKREVRHLPVLLTPVLEVLKPRPGQVIVDCTLGLGGHSAAILQRISPGGRVIGIDLDPRNLELARASLESIDGAF